MASYLILQNTRVESFSIPELLRENQYEGRVKLPPPSPLHPRLVLIHRLCIHLKESYFTMKKKLFGTKTKLLNFKVTVPLAKLDMVGSRLVSYGLTFLDEILVDIQLKTFLLLSSITELSIVKKIKKF